MRKSLIIILILFVAIACNTKNMVEENKGYTPEKKKLNSDILTPELLWEFGRLDGEHVSPDGKTVVFGVTYNNIEEDKSYRDLYSIPVSGGDAKQLTTTQEKEFNELWRPDGKKIGYLSSASGKAQLWEMNPDGTGKKQVSNIEGGITAFRYSPDMKKILYVKPVKLDKSVNDIYPDLPKANARLETDIMYRHWDRWHDYTYSHIFIADYNKGKVVDGKDIMEGERFDSPVKPFGGIEQINWSPDSKTLAYTCKKKTGLEYSISTNTDIYMYNQETGETKNVTEGMMGYDKNPVFSPDGNYLAWKSMERDGYEADKDRIFVDNLKTGERRDYSKDFDQNASGFSWTADSRSIYFISDIHATYEIFKLELKDGNISRITDGIHNYQSVSVAGDNLIARKVSMSQPAELYIVNPGDGKEKDLTTVNKGVLSQLKMGKVEKRWIDTDDNKKMLVWVIYPPNFDSNKKYPALLYCQGGPQSAVSQFWSVRWNFQMMAANDYIVVAPNRRGLPGFGQDWNEQISGDYGGQNMKDYLTAIDALSAEPFIDETRLGAIGASYGGYSTYYLAGIHEGRFKSFISHCGIFNLESMYTSTEEMWFVNWDLGGAYWDSENEVAGNSYENFSPHKFVQNWDTPMLVIHGAKDFRIPYTQGMSAFNAAKLKGIPAQFLFFPEENHWVSTAQNGILWQRVFFDWLDKWLKD
jgi:dipeptidyl aminopeptidase/acylaminoacyl peptidase